MTKIKINVRVFLAILLDYSSQFMAISLNVHIYVRMTRTLNNRQIFLKQLE